MANNATILIMDQPCDEAVDWVVERVSRAGLSVVRTFDLQVARQAQVNSVCPQHGKGACDCQVVVLLIYAMERQPLALVAHGWNRQTSFSVVNTPQQRADPEINGTIRRLFAAPTSVGSMV